MTISRLLNDMHVEACLEVSAVLLFHLSSDFISFAAVDRATRKDFLA